MVSASEECKLRIVSVAMQKEEPVPPSGWRRWQPAGL
jgi:hypothetical protein